MKKKIFMVALAVMLISVLIAPAAALAAKPSDSCTTIRDGVLTYSAGHYLEGQPLTIGYDIFGYNYQAHMFNGSYANAYLGRYGYPPYEGDDEAYLSENPGVESNWVWPYRNDQLMMKWSDIWLSNKDCNSDGLLDRGGPGGTNSAADGAWLTNHQRGEDETGNWTYYVKIVAPPGGVVDANKDGIDDNTGAPII